MFRKPHSLRSMGPHSNYESDFSPEFWLLSTPGRGGRVLPIDTARATLRKVSLGYSLFIGVFLVLAFLIQRNFFSLI